MKHLSKNVLEELHDALIAEKATLEAELSEHGRRVDGDWQGTATSAGAEPDEIDSADAIEELATNVPLVETLETRLKDVVDALAKIKNDTYGIDENTGDAIPIERLRANPSARTALQ